MKDLIFCWGTRDHNEYPFVLMFYISLDVNDYAFTRGVGTFSAAVGFIVDAIRSILLTSMLSYQSRVSSWFKR